MAKIYWCAGLLVAGFFVNLPAISTGSVNGELTGCTATDLFKIVLGGLVAIIAATLWTQNKIWCVAFVAAGAAMAAYGLNVGGVLCP